MLLDYSETFKLRNVGSYSARYGSLIEWPLEHVVQTAAGRDLDFTRARKVVYDFMQEDE